MTMTNGERIRSEVERIADLTDRDEQVAAIEALVADNVNRALDWADNLTGGLLSMIVFGGGHGESD